MKARLHILKASGGRRAIWTSARWPEPFRLLRALFLENRLAAGRFAVEGRVISLKDIAAPIFVLATENDHIAPWRSGYKVSFFTDDDLTFVLTDGGHNGGALSEPDTRCGRHKPNDRSWWQKWTEWLADWDSGKMVTARLPSGGDRSHPSLSAAPGLYVMHHRSDWRRSSPEGVARRWRPVRSLSPVEKS